jgi:hypothetical protein
LHRIDTRAVIDVDEIQADRRVADARLARTGLADLHFLPDQNFGTAGLVKANGMRHGRAPWDEMMMDGGVAEIEAAVPHVSMMT